MLAVAPTTLATHELKEKSIKIDNHCINNHNKDLKPSGVIVAVSLNADYVQRP
ncbi:Uncharacterised protein [Yersinia frederiksenii]|nr:Uncharacterised protein [Yersinia frederiksenii]CNJ16173.1 Uncharacterised protein [Yersinia frederiksenii]CNK57205.1 Uncharacterised protein [Yersinia frederiksenii]